MTKMGDVQQMLGHRKSFTRNELSATTPLGWVVSFNMRDVGVIVIVNGVGYFDPYGICYQDNLLDAHFLDGLTHLIRDIEDYTRKAKP